MKNCVKFIATMVAKKKRQKVGPVAQRITRLTTDQKSPGSTPGRIVVELFILQIICSTPLHKW
jgi:hypothetical protein